MRKYFTHTFCICVSVIACLLFSVQAFAAPKTVVDCSITKANGNASVASGYTTALTSVTMNTNGSYTIIMTLFNTGASGNTNKQLSNFCIQPGPTAATSITFQKISGSSTGSLVTTDANPVFSSGFKYTCSGKFGDGSAGSISLTYTISSLQVQQVAAKAGNDFNIVSFSVAELQQVYNCGLPQAPVFTPVAGTYGSAQSVSMVTNTYGGSIYYTTNGTTPTTSSTLYTGPITISANTTLKAITYTVNSVASSVTTGVYVINCLAPVLSPATGPFTSVQTVSMTSPTPNAKIYYTTDGITTPTTSSSLYSSPITVSSSQTIKAIAILGGMGNSDVTTEVYTITLPVATPTFSPVAGTYNSLQSVTISTTTSGASIYYTTNNTDPTIASTPYTGAITVDANKTIKAIAVKSGWSNSPVGTAAYIINCVAPVLTPSTGTYNNSQSVSMTTTTPGASIYYTVDGNTPTALSTLYTGTVQVGANMTLKAIAIKNGMGNSSVTSETYTILLPVSTPSFSPVAGSYSSTQNVAINCSTIGASIYYTTNGSIPTTASTPYSVAIPVGVNTTIKALAVKSGMSDSPVASSDYIIKCATPVISPASGTFTSAQTVTMTTTTPNATIYYTTDGSLPTTSSAIYSTGVSVSANMTLTAMAVKTGMANSDVATGAYVILLPVAAPTFTPVAGTYNSAQTVSISSTTPGVTIYYTTDNSTPNTTSPQYGTAINVGVNQTLKAFAVKSGMSDSPVSTAGYVINCAAPVLTPASGTYTSVTSVTMTTTTSGAAIYYTTDNSTPTTSSSPYTVPVQVGANMTLKAIAIKTGMGNSNITSEVYTILLPVAAPTFSPVAGTYGSPQSVAISSTTLGASIYYTTNGTTPTSASTPYTTGTVAVGSNMTLKALAVKTGMSDSPVSSSAYVIKCATPVLSPVSGTFTSAQTVTITTTTPNATIYYTTDGSLPTTSSSIYSTGVSVSANMTLTAMAVKTGMANSDAATGAYVILLPVAAPTFTPVAGTYNSAQTVSISSTTPGVIIYYTTDNSTPNTTSPQYGTAINVGVNQTLKAIAVKSGMSDSPVSTAGYVINCAAPVLTPATGMYTSVTSVTMTTATSGAAIYYTTDNSTPTTSSSLYTVPVQVGANMTLKAIAIKTGMGNSNITSEVYTILLPVATPTFSPVAGTYGSAQSVTISSLTTGASIYYTTDGSVPTTAGTPYTGTVAVGVNMTIKAIAVKVGMSDSPVASSAYLIKCATPVLSPASGNFSSPQPVTITTTTPNAAIYYTTDGTTPTTSSAVYSTPVLVGQNMTLIAIAVKSGMANSDPASGTYTVPTTAPIFSPPAGTYNSTQTVSISSTTIGALIYYTTDNSTPTSSSTLYTTAVSVGINTTLKAVAIKSGMADSYSTANYVINCVAPVLIPGTGTYTSAQSVTMTTTTSGSTIYYTTDNSTPTTSSAQYSTAINVGANMTLKAIAVKTGMGNSDLTTEVYTILLPVSAPTFSPVAGTYGTAQTVTISSTTPGAGIYYTTDGGTPTTASTPYTGTVAVGANMTIKAIAVKAGMSDSPITSSVYLIKCATPVLSPASGTFTSAQTVTITTSTPNATIYYSTDGSTPTTGSAVYSSAVQVGQNMTLNAIAVKSGMANSDAATGVYTILLPASAPVFSPPAGVYNAAQSVGITSSVSGASIRYTIDGSTPSDVTGIPYTGPVSISANTKLQAIAYKTGMSNSPVTSGDYIINCVAPVLTPATGTYTSSQSVSMTTSTSGASVFYTTDGSNPTTFSTPYTGAVNVGVNMTLKAIAVKTGMGNSDVTTEVYTILLPVLIPAFTPGAGTYNTTQSVAIITPTTGASIYYTTNGTTPTINSTPYSGPVSVDVNTTIKAIAVKSGMSDSPVATSTYVINCATPVMSPASGTYTSAQSVALTTTTPGATIYYTTDGSAPSSLSTMYSTPVDVSVNMNIKAIAVKNGMGNSDPASGAYTILIPASAPLFTPSAGIYNTPQSVTITTSITGASIRYTIDGSTPSDVSGILYAGPVTIGANTKLQAIAFKSGMSNSTVTSGDYVINCATPVLTPAGGTYSFAQSVSMTTSTPGATIYFTTDGSIPTATSTPFTTAVNVTANMTLKAIAIKSGMGNSAVETGDYKIKCGTPVLTPVSGIYTTVQTVIITSTTPGASIYFTTDGTAPTATNGTLYTTALILSANANLRVIALKTGFENSDESTGNYIINLVKVASPVYTPGAGTYAASQTVTISSTTAGATIRYTLDGTIPGRTVGLTATAPVTISANATLKAFAYKDGMLDSDPVSGDYKIKSAIPVFTPAPGNYSSAQTITITSATVSSIIKYTIDGSVPSRTNGTVYTVPVAIGATVTLKAISYIVGMEDSDVASGDYTIAIPKVASPVFTPVPGTFTTPQTIVISSVTEGATIRFTTDGTAPTMTSGTVYTVPFIISANTSFRAIAYMDGLTTSDVTVGNYIIALGANDTDGDGVNDNEDDYPTDPTRAYNNFYPAVGYGSLAYEDNWPFKADYDMNDMVIDYRYNQVTNALNEVVEVKAKIVLRAMGASFHNGFGVELPVTPAQVSKCVVTLKNGKPVPMGNLVSIDPATGLELNQDKAVVILFDDGYNVLPQNYAGIGVNTTPTIPWTVPDTLLMTITFKSNVSATLLPNPIYNPFIFADKKRGYEIHLPDFTPTKLADLSLFKTGEDRSDPANGKYYKTANNLPWALNIYEGYEYPNEKVTILETFIHFASWAESGGTLFPDWYKNLPGYRNAANVYTHP